MALKRRLKDSTVERLVLERIYEDFCESLQANNVAKWLGEVTQWEDDTTKPSPYHIPSSGQWYQLSNHTLSDRRTGLTEAEVKKQLLEDNSDVNTMDNDGGDHQVTAAAMLVALLNVEDQQ